MSTIARFTLAEYDRMIECGAFDVSRDRRMELIFGEIREMSPPGPLHEDVLDRLLQWSIRFVPQERIRIRVQQSLGLPTSDSAPEPDMAWVVQRDYSQGRPTAADTLLVIEVADSSLEHDQGEKSQMYAAAGIADYWIANLPERTVEVRRDPRGGRYRSITLFTGDEEVRPLAFPEAVLRPAMRWGQ